RVALLLVVPGVRDRALDRAAEHELVVQNAHGLPHGLPDDGLTRAGNKALEDGTRTRARGATEADDPAGQHETECRGIDEQRLRITDMALPVAAADTLVD